MLSEKDGSGIDFLRKLRTALIKAALCGKHRFLLTGLGAEVGPATDASTIAFPFSVSCSSTSILLSLTPAVFVSGCSVSMGTSSDASDCEGVSSDWCDCVAFSWVPWFSLVSIATLSDWLEGGEGKSGDSIAPWKGWHSLISCCKFPTKVNKISIKQPKRTTTRKISLRNGPDKNDSNNGNEHFGMQKWC